MGAVWIDRLVGGAATTRNLITGAVTIYWIECVACGQRQPPRYTERRRWVAAYEYRDGVRVRAPNRTVTDYEWHVDGKRGVCGACGTEGAVVRIRARGKAGTGRSDVRCGGACLNGMRSCDCRCMGRCHGAGECSCGGGP